MRRVDKLAGVRSAGEVHVTMDDKTASWNDRCEVEGREPEDAWNPKVIFSTHLYRK